MGFTQENADEFFPSLELEMVNIKSLPFAPLVLSKRVLPHCNTTAGKTLASSPSKAQRAALLAAVNVYDSIRSICAPQPLVSPEEYENRLSRWGTFWPDWYLSDLWLAPCSS
jgi:hypothetical protein